MIEFNLNSSLLYFCNSITQDVLYIGFGCLFTFVNFLILSLCRRSSTNDGVPTIMNSMQNNSYHYMLIAAITLSAFMMLDSFVDFFSSKIRGSNPLKKFCLNIFTLSTLLISSSLIFFVAISSLDYLLIFEVAQARTVCISCVSLTYAHYYGGSIWRKSYLVFVIPVWGISCHINSYLQYQSHIEKGSRKVLDLTALLLLSISVSIVLIPFFKWLTKLYKDLSQKSSLSNDDVTTAFYLLKYVICAVLYVAVSGNGQFQNFSANTLIVQELAFVLFITLHHMYETKKARQESSKYQTELEFKRMFVRYISHEIRTPLNTAIMGLQLLLESFPLADERNRDIVTEVRKSCDVAVGILNELLTFDKLEEGVLLLEKKEIGAVALIRETVEPFQVQARQAGITLRLLEAFEDSTTLGEIIMTADPNKISQVIRNLVSNGLKFTPQGGSVTVSIDIVQTEPFLSLKVDVTDTGAGISVENQSRLFKEIVQFNPGKLQKGGGSGLGLYISNGIVGLHGGKLSVSSAGEGCGCTFTLILPTDIVHTRESTKNRSVSEKLTRNTDRPASSARVATVPRGHPPSLKQHAETITHSQHRLFAQVLLTESYSPRTRPIHDEIPGPVEIYANPLDDDKSSSHSDSLVTMDVEHGMRVADLNIIVADDSPVSRKMLVRLLERRCKKCLEAEDGRQVVNLISSTLVRSPGSMNIHLIVMDAMMPVLSGLEATQRVREMGFKGIIIGLTGNVSADDIESFLQHGADAVLPKPLDVKVFDDLLLKLMPSHC